MELIPRLTAEFHLRQEHVENIVKLIDDGNTIPFIARYRKEMTGALDDQVLRALADRLAYLRGLDKRKEEVCAAIEEQGKLTPELEEAIAAAEILAEVEDLYRPYRQKRRTRASIAKERGLEPLAEMILEQRPDSPAPPALAERYVNGEKQVNSAEEAVAGALDIIAEQVSNDAALRGKLRAFLMKNAVLRSVGKTEEDSVYSMYYGYSEPVSKIAGHRVLAVDRGEREGFLKVSVECPEGRCLELVFREILRPPVGPCTQAVKDACRDAFSRLIFPSLEREIRSFLTETADENAIKVFTVNLKQLLMQPPLKGAVTMGFDPAYRTGCKLAVVDETGRVLETTVIYPTPPQNKVEEARKTLVKLIRKYGISAIAVGNGTASRESEIFVAETLRELDGQAAYMVVSEAGASVYSASKLAAEEFPEYDVSLRSAVSIARRLQDPLAELVKIDPKAIGVGQYQHDMPQNRLGEALSGVVEDCVNSVGVDLNTASESLLSYVAGINKTMAKNIVAYREKNGAFTGRKALRKVPKLGPRTFEQCAGFLRIPESEEYLDRTAVHPESYEAARRLLELTGFDPDRMEAAGLSSLREKAEAAGLDSLSGELGIGLPTLRDIIEELTKPGRDPRDELPKPLLRTDVMGIDDLTEGMVLDGTVRNVIDFGAFVDIGVHLDGLVHISEMSDRFLRHPSEAVKVGDIVTVRVIGVDKKKNRISLSMKLPRP